jgi:MerR family copper efflux transcriptional regulator
MNIGQAAKASGVNAKLIRYYEGIGLIPEAGRTTAGYRIYTPHDVNILRFVKRARTLGFSLERIQHLVGLWRDKDRASAEVKQIALEHVAELEAKIAEMRAMSDTLQELADACHGDHRPDCPILRDLENPGSRRTRGHSHRPSEGAAGADRTPSSVAGTRGRQVRLPL